jgi:hypothetical protein
MVVPEFGVSPFRWVADKTWVLGTEVLTVVSSERRSALGLGLRAVV